jgi:hypothetical protein
MNDAELEAALRRYRPAGPPPELRNAVVNGLVSLEVAATPDRAALGARRRDLAGWFAIAASVMLATMFYWLAAVERQRQSALVTPLAPFDQAAVHSSTEEPQP